MQVRLQRYVGFFLNLDCAFQMLIGSYSLNTPALLSNWRLT